MASLLLHGPSPLLARWGPSRCLFRDVGSLAVWLACSHIFFSCCWCACCSPPQGTSFVCLLDGVVLRSYSMLPLLLVEGLALDLQLVGFPHVVVSLFFFLYLNLSLSSLSYWLVFFFSVVNFFNFSSIFLSLVFFFWSIILYYLWYDNMIVGMVCIILAVLQVVWWWSIIIVIVSWSPCIWPSMTLSLSGRWQEIILCPVLGVYLAYSVCIYGYFTKLLRYDFPYLDISSPTTSP